MKFGAGRDRELLEALLAFEQTAFADFASFAIFHLASDAIGNLAIAPDAGRLAGSPRKADCFKDRLRLILRHLSDVENAKRCCR